MKNIENQKDCIFCLFFHKFLNGYPTKPYTVYLVRYLVCIMQK